MMITSKDVSGIALLRCFLPPTVPAQPYHVTGRSRRAPWPRMLAMSAMASQRRCPCGPDAIVVHGGEQLVGRLEQLGELGRGRVARQREDLFERPGELRVLIAGVLVLEVGEVGAERSEAADGIGGLDFEHGIGTAAIPPAFALGRAGDQPHL